MPGFARLGELIKGLREEYYQNLANELSKSSQPISQREIDYKRGFWQGALYATQRLPKMKASEWNALVAEVDKEGEDTGQ